MSESSTGAKSIRRGREALLELLKQAGVVGGGGAGFSTWKKLDARADIVLLNAAECEPVLAGDKYLMRKEAPRVVEGLLLAQKQVGAGEAVIAVKETYTAEIGFLEEAVQRAGAQIRIHTMCSIYPAGDEQVAVFEATGRTVPPGGIPLMVGVVVISVSTAVNIAAASAGRPVLRRLVTVAGEVGAPALLDVPVGAPVTACIEAAGGAAVLDYRVVMGGPMMGALLPDGAQETTVITKTDSGVLVLAPDHALVRFACLNEDQMLRRARSACIQCRYCTEQCPRYLLGHKLRPHRVMRAMALGEDLSAAADAALCCECGICELYACPMSLSPRRINRMVKPLLREAGITPDKSIAPGDSTVRSWRQVPSHRLARRVGVSDFAPPKDIDVRFLSVNRAAVPLRQHIGAACEACVRPGDAVREGQIVGAVPEGALGACVHAPFDGIVLSVEGGMVTIDSEAVR